MTDPGTAYGTDFTETEALLAVQTDDPQTLARLVAEVEARAAAWLADTPGDAA